MKNYSFFFDRIDYQHADKLLPVSEYKAKEPTIGRTELYGSIAPPFLKAVDNPELLIKNAESICHMLHIHSPLLSLCSTEKEKNVGTKGKDDKKDKGKQEKEEEVSCGLLRLVTSLAICLATSIATLTHLFFPRWAFFARSSLSTSP